MQSDQARTIFETVRRSWFLERDELLRATPGELEDELEMYPVDGVSLTELQQAVVQVANNPQWAE